MKSQGIRISDGIDYVTVNLHDILSEISDGNSYSWRIYDLEVVGNFGDERSIPDFENEIDKSENGLLIEWKDLDVYANLDQIIWITLVASKDPKLFQRFENEKEVYETFDIVIEMIDSSFWQVFSKDEQLIKRLAAKFKDIKFLETDFLDVMRADAENEENKNHFD